MVVNHLQRTLSENLAPVITPPPVAAISSRGVGLAVVVLFVISKSFLDATTLRPCALGLSGGMHVLFRL